jgi:cytoskeletal protein CcmA (bactofilin family)
MFSSNNNTSKRSNGTSSSSSSVPSVNMISEGTTVKGSLNTKNDVRVAGRIQGEATSEGKFILTGTGKVDGDVQASDADVAGKVEGELRVSNKLILRKTAEITGDIYTKVLLVEEGASFDGACKMSSNPTSKNGVSSSASKTKATSKT